VAAKAGQRKGPPSRRRAAGRQRLWLVVFAAVLVALFAIFAVAQGIGATTVPSGDAAIVKSVPSGEGTVSEAKVKRATAQQIASAISESKEKAPKRGSKKYEELQQAALGELLDEIWIKGQAEEMNISATSKQLEESLNEIKKQNFPTEAAFQEFLKKSHFTRQDVNDRVELQVLSSEIEERVKSESEPASASEIQAYYETEKATQFTTPASRDVRIIVNKNKSKVEAAHKLLEGDQSPKTWKEAASKYSVDPTTKSTGGLQKGVTEEFVSGPLKTAIFDGPTGQLSGVVEYEKNFLLVEPVKINPEKVKSLEEVRSQISQTLSSQKQEQFFQEFVGEYQKKWTSRTFCAEAFANERCSNFPASKILEKSREAYKSCFEANPKTPAKECPAPVTMTTPALPGTVTSTEPKGKQLVQRPLPEGGGKSKAESAAPEGATEGAPEAAPEEAPPEEAPSGG
jgi:parvulin-like peptidyl-prolyl isomerase